MGSGALAWGSVEEGWRKGPWTAEEDRLLTEYVRLHGEGRWNSVARVAGLKRNGKSCRLRWVNYLRPDLKRGQITPEEESIIIELQARWGNRWSTIARSLPGRTDNEIKNYWRTHFKKNEKPSHNPKRVKTRFIRQRQQQQQQQIVQEHQVDMKKMIFQLEENDYKVSSLSAQAGPEMVVRYPMSNEQYLSSASNGDWTLPEATVNEDFLWGGLWNLDDVHGSSNDVCATSKAMEQKQMQSFYSG